MANQAPVLSNLIDDYFEQAGISLTPAHRVEYLSMALSVVASTGAVCLLPAFARKFLTWSVISRPLAGKAPSIDLVLGYHKDNGSPVLALLLASVDELVKGASHRVRMSGRCSLMKALSAAFRVERRRWRAVPLARRGRSRRSSP